MDTLSNAITIHTLRRDRPRPDPWERPDTIYEWKVRLEKLDGRVVHVFAPDHYTALNAALNWAGKPNGRAVVVGKDEVPFYNDIGRWEH